MTPQVLALLNGPQGVRIGSDALSKVSESYRGLVESNPTEWRRAAQIARATFALPKVAGVKIASCSQDDIGPIVRVTIMLRIANRTAEISNRDFREKLARVTGVSRQETPS
jgi:hypothetical protein